MPSSEPARTLEATPATRHDVLTGIVHNGMGGTWLQRQVREWPHMSPRHRDELVDNLLSVHWLPQSAKNALRAAYE